MRDLKDIKIEKKYYMEFSKNGINATANKYYLKINNFFGYDGCIKSSGETLVEALENLRSCANKFLSDNVKKHINRIIDCYLEDWHGASPNYNIIHHYDFHSNDKT